MKAIHSFPLPNRWSDKEAKQYNRGIPQSFCQLGAKEFGKVVASNS